MPSIWGHRYRHYRFDGVCTDPEFVPAEVSRRPLSRVHDGRAQALLADLTLVDLLLDGTSR